MLTTPGPVGRLQTTPTAGGTRPSSRASSLLRNLEKELVDSTASAAAPPPSSSRRNSDTTSRFADLSRPSGSEPQEVRYGRSSFSFSASPSLSTASSRTVRALETRDEDERWNDFSSSAIPSRQPSSTRKHRGGEDVDYDQEVGRASSRLSNSAGCSPSGAGLTQSFADMNLRSRQDSRTGRSNSLTSRSSVQGKQVAGLVGLMNEGNTCFLNSCLQCLAHTVPLSSAILGAFSELIQSKGAAARGRRDMASLSDMLAYSFRQLLKDLWGKPSYSTASASMLLQSLQGLAPQFAGNRQHDAQEAMRTIIDGLHEALNRKPPGRPKCPEPPPTTPETEIADICWEHHRTWNNSVIQDIFCGQLQSTIECSVCHRKSHCFDPFLDLSLPLPKGGSSDSFRSFSSSSSRSRITIEDCLSAFVAPETLDPSNKYYCSGCKAPQICTKKLSIYRAPSVLVLHIKRFYGVEPRSYRKDDRSVTYPLNGLDLSNFMSSSAKRHLAQQATYDLYGVCSHFGSLGYGHYTATCRSVDGGWYCYNDSSVTSVQDPVDSSAYILFYQRTS